MGLNAEQILCGVLVPEQEVEFLFDLTVIFILMAIKYPIYVSPMDGHIYLTSNHALYCTGFLLHHFTTSNYLCIRGIWII